jgi:hypothetical protein
MPAASGAVQTAATTATSITRATRAARTLLVGSALHARVTPLLVWFHQAPRRERLKAIRTRGMVIAQLVATVREGF